MPIIQSENTNLYWHLGIANKFKWSLLGLTIISGALAALIVYSMEPVYRASSSLLIESNSAKFIPIQDVDGIKSASARYGEYIQTQIQILKSRALAEEVVSKLEPLNHPAFDSIERNKRKRFFNWRKWIPWTNKNTNVTALSEDAKRRSAIGMIMGGLTISPVRNSQIIMVNFDSYDPEFATYIVNVVTEVYIESALEARLQMVKKATLWLMNRMDGLQKKVEDSERILQEYKESEGLVVANGKETIVNSQFQDITKRLLVARAKRAELDNFYKLVQEKKNKSTWDLASHPIIMNQPLIQQLKVNEADAERKVSELSKRYGYKHPKMIAAKSDFSAIKNKLSKEIHRVIDGVKEQYKLAQANEIQLNNEFEAMKSAMQKFNRKAFTLKSLERDAMSNSQLYKLFLTRFKEASVSGNMGAGNARVLDPAIVPGSPIKPNKRRVILLTIMLSFFIGLLIAYFLEHMDNTIKTAEEAEDKLGLPVLGMVPLLSKKAIGKNNNIALLTEENIGTAFAEAIRTIRTGVVLSNLDTSHKIILVTSSVPQEGKTTVASNLAVSLGKMERVLLIDADMRSPSIGAEYGFPYNTPGLSELVAGTVEANICIQRGLHKHDLLLAGIMPPNPLELLSSKRFDALLKKLSENYDRIVIDSAPIQAVSDSLVLSQKASAVVYVVHTDETPIPQIATGIKRLREVNAPLTGIVLNKMVMKKDSYYGEYYYSNSNLPPMKYEKAS